MRLEFYAEVVEAKQLGTLEAAQGLRGQHIWRDEVIADRFEWGRARNIYAMALRVFRLPEIRTLPLLPAYGGCKSWVQLEEEIATGCSEPVLGDEAFRAKLMVFQRALESVAQTVSKP